MALTASQYPVRAPEWALTYAGANLTGRIDKMVTEIVYTDHFHGQAGDVEVKLEDRRHLWQGAWLPVQGDLLELFIGYVGESQLDCGDFQVDDLELEGPPDVFTIRAIPAYITPSLRTPRSIGYEQQTLLQVANTIAAKHGMTVVGAPNTINVMFRRVTQNRETDLAFLKRLANENDYDFTIRDDKIQFYSRVLLRQRPPVLTIQRTDLEKFQFKSKTNQIYKAAEVSYNDPTTGKLITGSATAVVPVPTGDTLRLARRAESGPDATQKANAALRLHNMIYGTSNLTVPGNILLVAGNNIAVSGFGKYDATYYIMTARHKLSRDNGYSTELELQRLPN